LNLPITHSQALELVAAQFGFENWNILAAKIGNNTADASERLTRLRLKDLNSGRYVFADGHWLTAKSQPFV
jgi:uncharacterized sporulation protein YeaH/YhbH (DUF444 family)